MRLITFGDSFTNGYGISESKKWCGHGKPDMFEDLYRRMNSWPRYTSERLSIPVVNMGKCNNFGNNDMYNLIKENIDELLKTDIVIVAFSYPYRNTTSPIDDYKKIDELLKPYKRFYFNAFYPMFEDEYEIVDIDFTNFIKPNYTFSQHLGEIEKREHIPLFQNNSWYTNELLDGSQHPNLNGYKQIGNYVYDQIKDKL
jgi:lysophospholipase L1-like esterase